MKLPAGITMAAALWAGLANAATAAVLGTSGELFMSDEADVAPVR